MTYLKNVSVHDINMCLRGASSGHDFSEIKFNDSNFELIQVSSPETDMNYKMHTVVFYDTSKQLRTIFSQKEKVVQKKK